MPQAKNAKKAKQSKALGNAEQEAKVNKNEAAEPVQAQELNNLSENHDEEEEPSEIDSFVLDEQETGDLSDDDDEDDEDSRLDEDLDDDEESDVEEADRFLLGQAASDADLDVVDGVAGAAAVAAVAAAGNASDIYPSFDPETQAKLEDLFETAGFGKLSGETKQFTDPEVLKRITSSVSCALDEAAAALTRMRSDPPTDGKTLVDACNEGDSSKVRKLLEEGRVSVHDTTEEGESLLSLACSHGYYELAQVLLAMRANVEDRGMKGDCTPLMEAASSGHLEIVRLLISHGADVNAQSSSGNTPLMYACASGHSEVVRVLLEAHANVEDHNENGHTPLMEAASAGHVEVAKILLEYGAGINTHSNEFKESALTLACYKGHLEMVRFLLEAGADQEHKTDEMHTALMEASMDGHVEVARLLLDSGAQVNMPADSFESPLTLAACGGHVELAMLLLERGANIEEVNDEGYTPLMEAAREGHEEMVALLLSQGADINAQTEETQETALTLACCGGFLDVADFLIKAGADIELGATTPLMEAAQEGHLELVKYLLEARADVNAQSSTGDTALSFACERGHTDVNDLLLKWGADLEHESEGGRTPLMKAVRAGHYCTAKFLISKGANVNKATTNNDHTPLSLACAGGHLAIVELLLQNKADPYHKLKDNSTMLIEAAKGGHTGVVSVLIDYNPANNNLTSSPPQPQAGQTLNEAASNPDVVSDTDLMNTRFPAEGHEGQQVQQASSSSGQTPASSSTSSSVSSSLPNKNNSAPKSVLRKTRSNVASNVPNSGGGTSGTNAGGSPKDSAKMKPEAGYDFIEGSGFVIEGLEDKGLDAKSYIQQMLRRTDGTSREEQIIQKEQILAELQRVERELQEKAQAQMMLNADENNPSCPSTGQIRATEMLEDMVHLSLNNVAAAAAAHAAQPPSGSSASASAGPATSTASSTVRNVTNLANLPPSERPKAKPSRKMNSQQQQAGQAAAATTTADKNKKCQLQAALQQHSQQLAQLQQLQQLNQKLQQQVLQQRQVKQQNQATLAVLQQNAIANQQQLAALQHDVAQLQILEQHILAQQTSSQNQQHQLQQRVQQVLQQKQQLQHQIKQFQQQVEQQLAYTQHATPSNTPPPPPPSASSLATGPTAVTSSASSSSSSVSVSSTASTSEPGPPPKKTTTKRANNDSSSSSSTSSSKTSNMLPSASSASAAAYELVQASQALQAVQALQHLDPSASANEADIEPLTQDPTLLLTTMAGRDVHLPDLPPMDGTMTINLPPIEASDFPRGLPYAYKEGFQASPDLARSIQAGSVQYSALHVSQADCGGQAGSQQVTALGHQLLLQSQFPFGQHVDANGQINFAGADMSGSSYLPGEAVFLPASMATSEAGAAFNQPDLPPATTVGPTGVGGVESNKKSVAKSKTVQANAGSSVVTGGKKTKAAVAVNNGGQLPADLVIPPLNLDLNPSEMLNKAAADALQPFLETYGDTAAVASAAVDLDSETDSNHDTALTLACAGGHEELVTLLINRGANIEHRDKKGFTPLILAATAGHDKVCEILLDHNADIEAQSERTKDTPLSLACSGGRYEVVEVLLRRNANKEHRNVSDYTPLALAASGGYVTIIKLLLAHGAEINSRTGSKLGISPLMLAAMNGHTASVKLLLDMGSDINAQIETNRNTALTLACFQGRHEVVSLLLDRKANVEHRAKTGLTPLMEAASGGFVDVGRVLLDKGADVNAPPVPSSRDTALTIAADKGHCRFVELLLTRGAQVDVRNKKGNSSLWLAANGGHLDVVQLLHTASADIDSQDNRKVSCLMAAFRKGHSKVVKWMVKHVSQFPSDTELTRYIATISDKDLLKKCHTCMEIIRVAKERQAAEAAKNASNLLEELDREKNLEESKKAAAARKREKKKRKKMEKLAEKGLLPTEDQENKENQEEEIVTEDEKEKTPELINNQDSGIDANSQASSSDPDSMMKAQENHNEAKNNNIESENTRSKSGKNKNKKNKKDKEESPVPVTTNNSKPDPKPMVEKKKESSSTTQPSGGGRVPTSEPVNLVQQTVQEVQVVKEAKKGQRQRRTEQEQVSSASSTKTTSPGNNKKKATNSPLSNVQAANVVQREDATGWKEVVRKSKKVIVPANAISRVIGRGGCNINAIREMSGAHIEVEKLQGKASSAQQTERTILIKGSAEATRQANNWIQQIINSPDKDMADILGKKIALPMSTTSVPIQSAVIINSNAKINSTSSLACVTTLTSTVATTTSKKVNTTTAALTSVMTSMSMNKPAAFPKTANKSQPSSSSFAAAVASGSSGSGDSFGMIQTGGTHPGTLAKVQANKKAKTPEDSMEFIGTFDQASVPAPPQQAKADIQQVAKANLDNKDYSPFKSYTAGWGGNNQADKDSDKNFGGLDHDLAAKAPGYRISPSGGPTLINQQTWGGNVITTSANSVLVRPIASTASSVMSSSFNTERSNSAPGSPIMPSPIGPPSVMQQMTNTAGTSGKLTTSPGSEPDQYRTGSSMSSGIGLSPGSASGAGLSNHIRSMTPDSDSMRGGPPPTSLASSNVRSGSMSMADKAADIFGHVRPASSGSANAGGFVVNPESLLSAAAQMASAFAASDMDYLGNNRSVGSAFGTNQDFNSRPVSTASYMPPTSKLNPNAPDFMRPPVAVTSGDYRRQINKNNFNSPPPVSMSNSNNTSFGSSRFNNSNNLPNILTNQGINAYLQSQMNNVPPGPPPPPTAAPGLDLSAFDTNLLSGRSIKEINELIAGASSSAPQAHQQQGPPFNYFNNEPQRSSRPIGSERSRLEPLIKQPSNNPWDLSGLYDTVNMAVNNDFGGFLTGGLHGAHPGPPPPTLDSAFNGFANSTGLGNQVSSAGDYNLSNLATGTPVMGMTPNVTPSKSDYGDYHLPSTMMSAPGSSSKKMGYQLDQAGLTHAGGPRGDPASVRRNMNQSWGKKWGDD